MRQLCGKVGASFLSGLKRYCPKVINEPDGGKYFRFWSLALRATLGPRSHLRRGPTHSLFGRA
jgi:hypothetical protein